MSDVHSAIQPAVRNDHFFNAITISSSARLLSGAGGVEPSEVLAQQSLEKPRHVQSAATTEESSLAEAASRMKERGLSDLVA